MQINQALQRMFVNSQLVFIKIKKSDVPLNTLRFEFYKNTINKSSFKLEIFPPTERAATQDSYRVNYQLETWLNFFNEQDNSKLQQWGWSKGTGRLVPTFISEKLQLITDTVAFNFY